MRGETLIFVCSYGCVVGPLKTGLCKLNGGSGRRHAVVITDPQMEKNMFFRNPRDAI